MMDQIIARERADLAGTTDQTLVVGRGSHSIRCTCEVTNMGRATLANSVITDLQTAQPAELVGYDEGPPGTAARSLELMRAGSRTHE